MQNANHEFRDRIRGLREYDTWQHEGEHGSTSPNRIPLPEYCRHTRQNRMAELYFYYPAMNAGKSTTLLQSAYNDEERGMRVLLMTPRLDNRHAVGEITSRIGLARIA